MLQNIRSRASDESGFTLIELLVVILIIGILAAIALPTFLGQKDKAKDASAKSDVRNAVSQMESCLVDETPANCTDDAGVVAALGADGTVSPDPLVSSNAYVLTAVSDSTNTFSITKNSTAAPGVFERSCVANKTGAGCPESLNW